MTANELRFKNLVLLDGIITEIGITQMCNFSFWEKCEQEFYPTRWEAIPLTEEWLLKVGFEKDDSGVEISDQDYCEWYQKEFPVVGILCQSSDKSYIFDENTDTLRLKYVHELQNLYFALTGSELVFSTEP